MKLVAGKTALADQVRGPLLVPKLNLLKAICIFEQSRYVSGGDTFLRTCSLQPVTRLMLAPTSVALLCRGMVSVVFMKALG